jgi:peptidase M23-like protein
VKTTTGVCVLLAAGLLAAVPARATRADAARAQPVDAGLRLDPVRPRWPVVREAAGRWVVVGEGQSRNTGSEPVAVQSVSFEVRGSDGAVVATETLTGRTLQAAFGVLGFDASGVPFWRPRGTTTLQPGDIGIAWLGTLAPRRSLPESARIRFALDGGLVLEAAVPLSTFDPGQRLGWPLAFESGLSWVARNTFHPRRAVPGHRQAVLVTADELFISQRFAIDTVQRDARLRTSDPPASPRKEDYYAWGKPIGSAGAGEVVAVVADQPDQEVGSADPAHPAGNYVVVRHGPQLYSAYAHMRQGSAAVQVGDVVEKGQVLGRIGNSGNTTEPHLHLQFVDRWDGLDPVASFFTSQGVPAVFWDAHVRRGARTLPLDGTAPLGSDLVVP